MTLPPSEIERIEKKAAIFAEQSVGRTELRGNQHAFNIVNKSYQAGAQAEAVRGMEMMVAFAEWITENADGYHGKVGIHWYLRLQEDDTKHTTDELLDIFIAQNQKAKA